MNQQPSSSLFHPNRRVPSSQASSKFREHLSVSPPSHHLTIERSQFSPESPPSSMTYSTYRRDVEARTSQSPPSPGFRERFKLFFDLRALGREPELMPIQQRQVPQWPPLHVEKRHHCTCQEQHARNWKRRRWWIVVLIIILLYLLVDSVFLNVSVVTLWSKDLHSQAPSTSSVTSTTSSATLPTDTQQCLSQYELNAPANPSSYPCSSCLSLLLGIPKDFSFANAQDGQQVQNAIQFCGLKAVFDSAGSDGQTNLSSVGWLEDVRFCAWNGVSCDGMGRVSLLQLSFPGVPASLPNELGSLGGLQTLQIVGNNAVPAGLWPTSFGNLTSLSNLHIESTAITSLPDDIFGSLTSVTTLSLLNNGQMGAGLASSLSKTALQNLVVNGQNLNNPFLALSSSSSLQSSLKVINLSRTSLSGAIPASISSFASLTELHLDFNSLQAPLPSSFPQTLMSLTLSNNTGLQGSLPSTLCASSTLKTCDMRATGISAGGGCGPCQFS